MDLVGWWGCSHSSVDSIAMGMAHSAWEKGGSGVIRRDKGTQTICNEHPAGRAIFSVHGL